MFFQTMFQMMRPGVDYNLTLSRTDGRLTVLVMPKINGLKDSAQQNLVPLTLTGAPDEIDRAFFAAIQQPVARTASLLTNMAEYEKQAEKAAAQSKQAKDEKAAKPVKGGKEKEAKEATKQDNDLFMISETPQPTPVLSVPQPSQQPAAPQPAPQPAAPQPIQSPAPAPQPIPQQPQMQPQAQPMQSFYPQQPKQSPQGYPAYPTPQPQQSFSGYPMYPNGIPAEPLYNPDDYAGMPDLNCTHVAQTMQTQNF